MSLLPFACVMASVACGDDGGTTTTPDAGMTATSMDGGSMGQMPPPQGIPRRDAQVADTTDPITPCNRNNPSSCPAGEVCDLLYRASPTSMGFSAQAGCVEATRERAEGDPCNPDFTAGEQYKVEGLKDVVFRDPCGPGLVCAPNRKVRGAFSCQVACSSGRLDQPFNCEDPTALCARGSQVLEFCRKPDNCSIEKQTGCLGGEACYLIPSDDNKQLLAFCSPDPMTMASPDNMPGCSPVSCNPGSVCLGPVRMPINSWTDTNVMCRPVCNGEMGTAPDATADEDAGLPSGLCAATARCEPYSASGLLLSSISAPPFGQCEDQ